MASSRWSLRNIYLYLVCLITLIMVIVSVVGLVRDTVRLIYPEVGYYYETPVDKGGSAGLTEEEITKQRELDRQRSQQQAVYSIVGNAAMLLVAGPLYIYHWRKIEVEHTDRTDRTDTPAVGV